jgi:hypothetical protein
MTELDRDMLRHLRAYRGETRPSAEQRDRALAGLMSRVRGGEVVDIDFDPSAPAPRSPGRARWVLAAASIAGLAVGGASLLEEPERVRAALPPAAAAPYDVEPTASEAVAPTKPAAPARVDPPQRVVVPEPPAAISEPNARRHVPRELAPRRAPTQPVAVPVVEPSIDAAEVALLRRAQAELASDPAGALARLVAHADAYPDSSLAAEREVARVAALCGLGRIDEARERADAFEQKRPDSPLLPRLRRICREAR